jgi:hypothetical protein
MSNRTEAAWQKLRHCHREANVTAPLLDSTTGQGFAWLSFFTYSISAVAKLRDHISGREIELLQQRGESRVVVQALQ